MTARFAGSRSLDERRRRRLASESEEIRDELPETPQAVAHHSRESREKDPDTRRRRASRLPLRKVISPRIWKLCFVGFLGLAVGVGILVGAWSAERFADRLGPGFVRLFDLSTGRLIAVYNAGLLLLAGQLSLTIWWVRSRSLKDFNGRYRVWAWNAAATFFLAFVVATDAHVAWAETLLWLRHVEFWNIRVLCGLVPIFLCALAMLRWIYREVRPCRSSFLTLGLAGVCFAVAAESRLTNMLPIRSAYSDFISAGVLMLGHLCYFMSLLFHIRYVVYESFDPPAGRQSRFSFRLPRIRLRPRARSGQDDLAKTKNAPRSNEKTSQRRDSAARAGAADREPQTDSSEPVTRTRHKRKLKAKSSAADAQQLFDDGHSANQDTGGDEPIDAELLKGLSKRERRKLRKEWREQQRANRSPIAKAS